MQLVVAGRRIPLAAVFMVLAMLVAGFGMVYAQTADSTVASGGNADAGYGIEAFGKIISMALGSWLFAQWNKTKAKIDGFPNSLKALAVTALVTGLGMLGTLLHVTVSKEVADWGQSFWLSLASGGVTALVGKITIASKKAQPTTA